MSVPFEPTDRPQAAGNRIDPALFDAALSSIHFRSSDAQSESLMTGVISSLSSEETITHSTRLALKGLLQNNLHPNPFCLEFLHLFE